MDGDGDGESPSGRVITRGTPEVQRCVGGARKSGRRQNPHGEQESELQGWDGESVRGSQPFLQAKKKKKKKPKKQ